MRAQRGSGVSAARCAPPHETSRHTTLPATPPTTHSANQPDLYPRIERYVEPESGLDERRAPAVSWSPDRDTGRDRRSPVHRGDQRSVRQQGQETRAEQSVAQFAPLNKHGRPALLRKAARTLNVLSQKELRSWKADFAQFFPMVEHQSCSPFKKGSHTMPTTIATARHHTPYGFRTPSESFWTRGGDNNDFDAVMTKMWVDQVVVVPRGMTMLWVDQVVVVPHGKTMLWVDQVVVVSHGMTKVWVEWLALHREARAASGRARPRAAGGMAKAGSFCETHSRRGGR